MAAPERSRQPLRLAGALLAALLAAVPGAGAAADQGGALLPEGGPAPGPHHGEALFQHFRQASFSALGALLAAQHFGRLDRQADEAELLHGVLLLACGLHREAEQVLARLGERGAAGAAARDGAWFQLARLRYQRGLPAAARAALGRIGGQLPAALRDERLLLEAQLLTADGDHAGAARLLEAAPAPPQVQGIAAAYRRYNLAVALLRGGAAERGNALLDELGRAPGSDEESRSLRDQANVALGVTALQQGRPEYALAYLQRVRLHGLQANQALLGFGWAAAAEGSYKQALVPLLELLGRRDAGDGAVLEARLAVPYVYAAVGAHGQALQRYQDAIAAFEREDTRLDAAIAALHAGRLLDALIERHPGEEMGGSWRIDALPELPHAGHLAQMFARHEFQEASRNYRDLRFLERRLREERERLAVFGALLDEQRRGFAERLPALRAAAALVDPAVLRARRAALAAELAVAEAQADGRAFADARQRAQLARLEGARAALRAAGSDPAAAATGERVRLAAGALAWDLALQRPARAGAAGQGLQALDAALAEAQRREEALARAERDEPARLARFAAREAELAARIEALLPQLAALAREQQAQVQALAVAELRRQKERLAAYSAQARFAVAQLYDRASLRGEADHAAPR